MCRKGGMKNGVNLVYKKIAKVIAKMPQFCGSNTID